MNFKKSIFISMIIMMVINIRIGSKNNIGIGINNDEDYIIDQYKVLDKLY